MNAFGRYEIVRRIGVGGMGEVFFAWAYGVARTRKPVVVKVLRSEMLSEPGAPEMFVEEGRLSLHLNHMNILQVFDFGKADDRYFMAMEYVDGLHLGELRKKAGGRLNPDVAAFIVMEVCLALDYAHRLRDETGKPLQIVHRDVTPSNVLISREGEVKLADFGIARAVGRSQHTQAGQIRGKVRYMSPEAARGEPLDHRSDLFSLGAILFELLTGRRAFDATGGREAVLKQIVNSRAPAPSMAGTGVHPALDAVVLKAMHPNREERFPDAFAMHRGIEEACRDVGLNPGRGSFLEFLRGLDTGAGGISASVSLNDPAPPVFIQSPTPAGPPSLPSGGTAAVPPPEAQGKSVVVGEGAPGGEVMRPSGSGDVPRAGSHSGSRSSSGGKPSASNGTVPPVIQGPQSKTGAEVLFTLVVGDQRPDPISADLPVYEVTREGLPMDLDLLPPAKLEPSHNSTRLKAVPPTTPEEAPANAATVPVSRKGGSQPKAALITADSPTRYGLEGTDMDRPVDRPSDRPTEDRPKPERTTDRPVAEPTAISGSLDGIEIEVAPTVARPVPRKDRVTEDDIPASPSSGAETVVRNVPPPFPRSLTEPVIFRPESQERTADSQPLAGNSHWKVHRQERVATADLELPAEREPAPQGLHWVMYALMGAIVLMAGAVVFRIVSRPNTEPIITVRAATPTPSVRLVPTPTAPTRTPPPMVLATPSRPRPTDTVVPTPVRPHPTEMPLATPLPADTRVAVLATPHPKPAPTARVAASAAVAAEPGMLKINTQPWTQFTIAGRQLTTPVMGEKIPPGHYRVTLHNPPNPKVDRTIDIDVRSGQTTQILLNLTQP